MTREELDRLEAIEAQTRSDAKDAKMEADAARVKFGEALLATAGIVMNETVCEYFGWNWDSTPSRGVVSAIDANGLAVVCQITKSGKVHMGRNSRRVEVGKLAIGKTA